MRVSRIKISLLASIVSMLAACGGGGGGDETAPDSTVAASLIGQWEACFNDGTNSEFERFDFSNSTPASSTQLAFSLQYDTFTSRTDCSGTPTTSETFNGIMTLDGPKTIGSETAERVTLKVTTPTPETVKQVFVISSTTIKPGEDPTSDRDAEGYPNALQTSGQFIKQ